MKLIKKNIDRILLIVLTIFLYTSGFNFVNAGSDIYRLVQESNGLTESEINNIIDEMVSSSKMTREQIISQMLKEIEEAKDINSQSNQISFRSGGGGGKQPLIKPRYYGDIFYEPASTAFYQHGHVGIYYSSDLIVEAQREGVIKVERNKKLVLPESKVFTLTNVSVKKSDEASNWAHRRIGEPYSYNFVNNRNTGHYGAKNCSKLVWSAYMEAAGVDIDSNGGFGVYPKDILNYKYSKVYKSY